jgi:hypothetical protein
MRTLWIATLITLATMSGFVHAQRPQQNVDVRELINAAATFQVTDDLRKIREQQADDLRKRRERIRESQERERTICDLPDGSSHRLNAVASYEGETYRCVEVFTPTPPALVPPGENQTLTVRIAGWVKVQP